MTDAIGYIRVSTAEQASSGLGLDAQRRSIGEACRARGWQLLEVHADEGLSATAKDRPALDAAVAACTARKGSVLVVARLDRLARSLATYAAVVEASRGGGWRLCPLDAPDGSTPHGEAMQGVSAVFAQLERRLIGQRTREALAAARARGVSLGRPETVPAEVVALALDLRRRRRLSARRIAAHLAAEGIPAPAGGHTWHTSTVARLLSRRGVALKRGRPRVSGRSRGRSPAE